MAIQQQLYKFKIRGEIAYGDKTFHLHPENFVDLIRISSYKRKVMPMILARLSIDKNLFDYIIKNAEDIEVQLIIEKFTESIDGTSKSPAVEYINDTFLVSVSSDINYNKELDYKENLKSELPVEDKFRETYIGFISKACMDANKIVANEVVYQTMMQDLVLSYLLERCHLLIEPFDHNNMHSQIIIPPLDTTSSVIKYLNSMSVFYNTKYVFFFDEPYATYLLSKNGNGVKSKTEKYNTVNINLRGPTDNNNLVLGMIDNPETSSYDVDIPVAWSNYNIDQDTVKMVQAIDSIINPSIDYSKVASDIIKNFKTQLKNTMKQYLLQTFLQSKLAKNMGEKLSSMIPKMTHAIDTIRNVSQNLQKQVSAAAEEFQSTVVDAVGSATAPIREQCGKILDKIPTSISTTSGGVSLTINIMSEQEKSIQKSMLDSRFIAAGNSREEQKNVKSNFGEVIDQTANQYYKQDFIDNAVSAVTYINFPDVAGATNKAINNFTAGVGQSINNMATKINSKLGHFDNFANKTGEILGQVTEWEKLLLAASAAQSGGGGNGSSQANSAAGQLLKLCNEQKQDLTIIKDTADEYGGIANATAQSGNQAQDMLQGAVNIFGAMVGSIADAATQDIKSQFVSNQPARIFGNTSLSIDQMLMAGGGGCFGGGGNTGMAGMDFGTIAQAITGSLNFGDLMNISNKVMNFDLGRIGTFGIGHVEVKLNLSKMAPGLGDVIGTKILRSRNDNPNELKNIKSEIELLKNRITVSKVGIAPDVFTPNKKYIIHNYDGHSQKDGKFILDEKVEVYTKEADDFICKTSLRLSKIMENTDSGDVKDVSTPNPNAPIPTQANK